MANVHPRRRAIRDHLVNAAIPMTCRQLADELQLPLSSTRFHLDGLIQDGMVTKSAVKTQPTGRPTLFYAAVPAADDGIEHHRQRLLELLLEALETPPGHERAQETGKRWGRRVAASMLPPPRTLAARRAVIVETLAREGYGPTDSPPSGGRGLGPVDLTTCPFVDVAARHPDIVCALHVVSLAQMWKDLGGPGMAQLRPFHGPRLCQVQWAE